MKIVYSYCSFDNKAINTDIDLYVKMAEMSLFYVQQQGYETLLYVDKQNYKKFKHLPYNEIKIFDQNILNQLPEKIWCLGKLIACTKLKEPFVHMDFDVFMFKDHIKNFKNYDSFTLYREQWLHFDTKFTLKKIYQDFSYLECIHSFNCGIFGGKNFNIINSSAQKILSYCINNKNYLNDLNLKIKNHWYLTTFIEQGLFINLINYDILNKNKITTIIQNNLSFEETIQKLYNNRLIHLVGHGKNLFIKRVYPTYKEKFYENNFF